MLPSCMALQWEWQQNTYRGWAQSLRAVSCCRWVRGPACHSGNKSAPSSSSDCASSIASSWFESVAKKNCNSAMFQQAVTDSMAKGDWWSLADRYSGYWVPRYCM
jgi:hypothetical protein